MKEMRWRVGNERHIIIDEDNQVAQEGSSKLLDVGDVYRSQSVCHLINERGRWKEREIQANFPRSEAETILNTPLRRNGQADKIFWDLDSKRIFFVKSAYHFASNIMALLAPPLIQVFLIFVGNLYAKQMWCQRQKSLCGILLKISSLPNQTYGKKINYL